MNLDHLFKDYDYQVQSEQPANSGNLFGGFGNVRPPFPINNMSLNLDIYNNNFSIGIGEDGVTFRVSSGDKDNDKDSDKNSNKDEKNGKDDKNNRKRKRTTDTNLVPVSRRPPPPPPIPCDHDIFKDLFPDLENDDKDDSRNVESVCSNPLCDHKDYTEEEKLLLPTKNNSPPRDINNVGDLIELGKSYHCKKNTTYYGINLRILNNLVPPLTSLNQLIGMTGVKENIVNQIVFFLQGFNVREKCGTCIDCCYSLPCPKTLNNDMLHTVITGPPGVGKTELGKILGQVYKAMGVLSKGQMKIVSRSDLIGKYLGHTAAKTQGVINECKGGVMFIDEAYSLGNSEGRDSFSKECIDTINQNLTEQRDFLCIIAGYKDSLDDCFFKYNEGLRRRFTFTYDIPGYNGLELNKIFELKVREEGWRMEYDIEESDTEQMMANKMRMELEYNKFFEKNILNFPHFGGDMETLFLNCKIHHGRRVLFLSSNLKRSICMVDLEKGFERFMSSRRYKELTKKDDPPFGMYC